MTFTLHSALRVLHFFSYLMLIVTTSMRYIA